MIPEDKNLTGEQIQNILDVFLYKALEPIILNSSAFTTQVVYVLTLISTNRKRKPSSLPRERTVDLLCHYLAASSPAERYRAIRDCRLERSFLHVFIKRYLSDVTDYVRRYNACCLTRDRNELQYLNETAKRKGCSHRKNLYAIVQNSQAYLKLFYEYRSLVLNKYVKKASSHAKRFTTSNGSHIDFNDARQGILKSIIVALDKYDSDKGALTTYINWWVLNAQTCKTDHEYGIAYVVPQAQKKKIAEQTSTQLNHSVSLDAMLGDESDRSLHSMLGDNPNHDEDMEREADDLIVRQLVKAADLRGIVRLILDIDEVFTTEDYVAMQPKV